MWSFDAAINKEYITVSSPQQVPAALAGSNSTPQFFFFYRLQYYSHTSIEVETLHFCMIVIVPRQIGAERFTEKWPIGSLPKFD